MKEWNRVSFHETLSSYETKLFILYGFLLKIVGISNQNRQARRLRCMNFYWTIRHFVYTQKTCFGKSFIVKFHKNTRLIGCWIVLFVSAPNDRVDWYRPFFVSTRCYRLRILLSGRGHKMQNFCIKPFAWNIINVC